MGTPISKNFTLEEMTASSTARLKGIRNVPGQTEVINLCALVHNVLQPLRNAMGRSIKLNSGYRCLALNTAVGGVKTSQHMKGEAADINIEGDMTWGKKMFNYIRANLPFDQLIWEHNSAGGYWIHVSYKANGTLRKQVIENLLKR